MIQKYKKKPVIIEAIVFEDTLECLAELSEWTNQDLVVNYSDKNNPLLGIKTLEDKDEEISHWATVGDYIIKGIAGEFYPCKPDIFINSYEKI